MTKAEIKDIFVKEMLVNNDTRIALINTRYQIVSQVLYRLARPLIINDADWELLLSVAFCQSRLDLFFNIPGNSLVIMNNKILKDILYLYEVWLKVVTYLYDNFNNFNSSKFNKLWSRDQVQELKNIIAGKYKKLSEEFNEKEKLTIDQGDFGVMGQTFIWFQDVLLGREIFVKYMEELNTTGFPVLREFQKELIPSNQGNIDQPSNKKPSE